MSNATHPDTVPCFARDGGAMPVLGLGTFQSGGADCRNAVRTALDTGYRHIDTAQMYENEQEIGKGIRDSSVPRDRIFLTTKLQMGQLDPDGVRASCANSLRALGTDYVDLLLIHWPEESVPLADTLGAMAALKQEGKIRHLGVSNFTVAWLEQALAVSEEPIFCNQIEYHPYIKQGPPMKVCHDHGLATVAYSPLARGQVLQDERLAEIGRKYGKSPAQIALRWLVRQTDVVAIPKGTSAAHIRENLDIFDFALDADDVASIGAFDHDQRLIDPEWAPRWDRDTVKEGGEHK
ncbi:MAG: aldo/keto reductase [Candidatus Marinimicrobia bacterium]|nr:aldo/keto reductase [Candidatus Neomarinimicrobiota bacterium]